MAKAPVSEEILKEKFGPHLNFKPPSSRLAGFARSRISMAKTPLPSTAEHRCRPRNPIYWVSSPESRWALVTSTTTGACACILPERLTNWRSAWTEAQFHGARSPKRKFD